MQSYEQQGRFYLGRRIADKNEAVADEPLLYDARDLTTHAVCVGMTGSGKTGLGIALLEEAALGGIPALIIDPKGDMADLLLTFPDLAPSDFRPWIDADAARRRELSLEAYAAQVARSWRDGLAEWGIDGRRIARLQERAQFVVYTPGSDAGRQVSILQSLRAPHLGWEENAEVLREMISNTVSALLSLVDVKSDPVSGRDHNLLATIVENAWRAGEDVDLARLVVEIQKPSFDRLGVLPLEVYYPAKERMSLVMALNGLLASPRFAAWLEGDPLRVEGMLHAPEGRSQVSIFHLAHLADGERLFFVTLLLAQVRAWLRAQEGTPRLRAILYFDELYGFMPPHPANPPTKVLLLTLLKQARSQGLGLFLSTQNPNDLDYKGLSNAGTWFIGKLQTENDRHRVLEGLDGASLEAGVPLDRAALGRVIAGLGARTFLLHNVRAGGPVRFKTRHTMSYLRGPLTRQEIRQWMDEHHNLASAQSAGAVPQAEVQPRSPDSMPAQYMPPGEPVGPSPWDAFSPVRPVLPPDVREYYAPARLSLEWAIRGAEADGQMILYRDKRLVCYPALLARAVVRIDNATHDVHEERTVSRVISLLEGERYVDWHDKSFAMDIGELDDRPAQGALFAPLPSLFADVRRLQRMRSEFEDYAYRETTIQLTRHRALKLTARVDESEGQFRKRCCEILEQRRDSELDKLEQRYDGKTERLLARIRREERELERDETEHNARKREELVSAGESLLNLFSRRRSSRILSVASRKRRLTAQSKADVEESLDTIEDLEQQIEDLIEDLEQERAQVRTRWAELADDLETILLRPRKADVYVEEWGIVWLPYWTITYEQAGVERQRPLPAFEAVEPGKP